MDELYINRNTETVSDNTNAAKAKVSGNIDTTQAGVSDSIDAIQAGVSDGTDTAKAVGADNTNATKAEVAGNVDIPKAEVSGNTDATQAGVAGNVGMPKAEVSEKVREEILEVAAEKMRSVGIRSVSIDDICRQLGMSKKTFYVYFESKDQLVKELLLLHERKMEEKMLHEIEGKSVIQILCEWAEIAQRNEKDMEQTPPLVYDLDKYYPALSLQHRERLCDMMYRGLLRFIRKGQEEGVFRAELDTDLTARLFAYWHHLTLEQLRLYPKRRDEITAIARQGFVIAGRGIITEQGLRAVQALRQQKPTT